MRRYRPLLSLLLVAACAPTPVTPTPATAAAATVIGALPATGAWHTAAVALARVVLVQAEIGGPGLATALTSQAALEPDNRFAVPFAAVPYGENRPVRVTGYGIDGRPVPGVVLEGWLTVNADGFRGQTSAASTPIGAALRSLWGRSPTDAMAALIARQVSPDDLQAFLIKLNADSGQDYSLMDGERIAAGLLQENRSRTAFDIAGNGVRLPSRPQDLLRRPARVRGTLYGLQADDGLRSLTLDDPLSPGIAPLPTVAGSPFLFYPVAPGARLLSAVYGPTATATQTVTYRKAFAAADGVDTTVDLQLPTVSPRQAPPGATLTLTGAAFGTSAGTATLGLGTAARAVTVARWTPTDVAVTLPNPMPSGAPLLVVGPDWQWESTPLPTLAGEPRVDQATVTVSGAVRQLQVTGTNFSAYGSDHVVTLTGSDGVAVAVPVTRNGAGLTGTVPAGVTGSVVVRLSIGGVPSTTTPAVTVP